MKVPVFITSSSLFLAAWLGLTYVNTAPVASYQDISAETPVVETKEAPDLGAVMAGK